MKKQRSIVLRSFLAVYLIQLLLIGCSKDNGGSSLLNADAGVDQNILIGSEVILDGSYSSDAKGEDFTFAWKFISKPENSAAEFEDYTSVSPGFIADKQGKYRIELTIANTGTDADTVTVSAFRVQSVEGTYTVITPGPNVGIRDFEVVDDILYATCEFTEIGGISANKIAGYNGSVWFALGCGLEDGSIYDMIGYDGDLYVTGMFDEIGCISAKNIARWNGISWEEVGGGLTGGDEPYGFTMALYNNDLYVGGKFTQAGDINAVNLARWDGDDWSAAGNLEGGSVRDLQEYKQKLYAGGFFSSVDDVPIGYIASYNGISWTELGTRSDLELKATGAVRYMEVFQDLLYISGDFSGDDYDLSELITWDGERFSDFGRAFSLYKDNTIKELTEINGILYIGGSFENVVGSHVNNFLQWDGETWGVPGSGISGSVLSMVRYEDNVYIGGDFEGAGGMSAENIVIWTANPDPGKPGQD
jgi:hypothetical protein